MSVIAATVLFGAIAAGCASTASPAAKNAPFSKDVLLVGSYKGKAGAYTTRQP